MDKLIIKKIPLENVIEILTEMYDNGIEYVDMIVQKGKHQDSIWFSDGEKYSNKEEKNNDTIDFYSLI